MPRDGATTFGATAQRSETPSRSREDDCCRKGAVENCAIERAGWAKDQAADWKAAIPVAECIEFCKRPGGRRQLKHHAAEGVSSLATRGSIECAFGVEDPAAVGVGVQLN